MKKVLLAAITLLISSEISIAQDKWQNVVTNTFGGDPGNKAVTKMHVFKGEIYAGTGNNLGEVYRSSTGHPGSWSQTFAPPFVTSIDDINSTTEGGGYIYVSGYASGSDSPRISRSADGSTWVPYYQGYDRFPFVFPFKGTAAVDSIYIVREVYPFSMILKSSYDNNDPLDTTNSFDTVFTTPSFVNIKSYAIHNNKIYVGTNAGGRIWISSTNGNSWQEDTLFQAGFGNSNNYEFTAMASYGGYLYVGTENSSDGAQIWRSNNDTTWTNVASFPGSSKVTSLNNLSGKLWVTLESGSKGKILKSTDGLTYAFSDSVGFGANGNEGMRGSTVLFNNHIYYGYENYYSGMPQMKEDPSRTGSGPGGQVWRYCLGVLPTVNLGADQTVCEGVAVTFDAGSGHAAYEWSNETTLQTISVIDPDHYRVVVTGTNGCQNSDTVRLINTPAPSVYVSMPEGKGPHIVCKGDTLDIFVDVNSNLRNPLSPINKTTSVPISNSLGTTYDTITVSGINDWAADALYSVTIDSLRHDYDGDLTLSLQAPDGSSITLAANIGSSGKDYMGTVFSKNGPSSIISASPPFTGNFYPFNPFSGLSGSADGQWILRMDDNVSSDDGSLKGWSIRFSEKDTIMTYSWTPATGLTASNTPNVQAIGNVSTTYGFVATNSIGCSSSDTVDIYVPKMQVASASVVACYGDSVMISATGGNAYNWFPAIGLTDTTSDTIYAAPTVPTTYYVSDTINGFCYIIDSVLVNANPQIMADAGVSQTICFSAKDTLTGIATGGTAPYTYLWSGGGSNYTTQNVIVGVAVTTTYTLVVTDNNACTAADSTSIIVIPSTNVYGNVVDTSGVSVPNASVVIYKYLPFQTHFDTIQTTTTNASGDYQFIGVDYGDYLIEVFADTAVYPTAIPTYYGDAFLWDSSTVVVHGCIKNDTADITLIEIPVLIGPGRLSGNISKGPGFGNSPTKKTPPYVGERSDPIPDIDVKLGKKPGGSSNIVGQTVTDANGNYQFDNLPLNLPGESYVVLVDIPGLGRDSSYVVSLTVADSVIINLDYIADSVIIYIPIVTTGINDLKVTAQNKFSVYPNPANNNAVVEYTLNNDANVTLDIYNVLGVKAFEAINNDQQEGTYKYNINIRKNNLSPGIYFITLRVDGKATTQRLIVIE